MVVGIAHVIILDSIKDPYLDLSVVQITIGNYRRGDAVFLLFTRRFVKPGRWPLYEGRKRQNALSVHGQRRLRWLHK